MNPSGSWACPRCGRRPPAAIVVCRCGYERKSHEILRVAEVGRHAESARAAPAPASFRAGRAGIAALGVFALLAGAAWKVSTQRADPRAGAHISAPVAESARESARSAPTASVGALADKVRPLLLAGRFDEAAREFDALVREKPMSRNGSRLLEELYRLLRRDPSLDAAVESWCATPGRSHVPFVLRALKRSRDAFRMRGQGWASDVPGSVWPQFEDAVRAATADMEEAARREPADPNPTAYLIALGTYGKADRSQLERRFSAAVRADPLSMHAYEAKLTYLLPKWHGSFAEAEDFAAECEAKSPPGSTVYTIRLKLLIEWMDRSGDRRQFCQQPDVRATFERTFSRWVADYPGSTYARSLRGLIRSRCGDLPGAMQSWDEALSIDPTMTDVLAVRAEALLTAKDYDGAERDFRAVLAVDPQDATALGGLGMIEAYGRHDNQKSYVLLRRASVLPSTTALVQLEYGRACTRLGLAGDAVAAFSRAIERDRSWAAAYRRRGMALWATDHAAALRDFESARRIGGAAVAEESEAFVQLMTKNHNACIRDVAAGCAVLGRAYAQGYDVPRDPDLARSFLTKACRLGLAEACAEAERAGEPSSPSPQ